MHGSGLSRELLLYLIERCRCSPGTVIEWRDKAAFGSPYKGDAAIERAGPDDNDMVRGCVFGQGVAHIARTVRVSEFFEECFEDYRMNFKKKKSFWLWTNSASFDVQLSQAGTDLL